MFCEIVIVKYHDSDVYTWHQNTSKVVQYKTKKDKNVKRRESYLNVVNRLVLNVLHRDLSSRTMFSENLRSYVQKLILNASLPVLTEQEIVQGIDGVSIETDLV